MLTAAERSRSPKRLEGTGVGWGWGEPRGPPFALRLYGVSIGFGWLHVVPLSKAGRELAPGQRSRSPPQLFVRPTSSLRPFLPVLTSPSALAICARREEAARRSQEGIPSHLVGRLCKQQQAEPPPPFSRSRRRLSGHSVPVRERSPQPPTRPARFLSQPLASASRLDEAPVLPFAHPSELLRGRRSEAERTPAPKKLAPLKVQAGEAPAARRRRLQPRWRCAKDRQPAGHEVIPRLLECPPEGTGKPGHTVMRPILLVFLLAAGAMYVILHCNIWRTNSYWLPPAESDRKEQLLLCSLKSNISTLIKEDRFYPFLCSTNFLQLSRVHGSRSLELPYGIRRAERYFQMALSRLDSCGLFTEDDGPSCKKCVVVGNGGVLRNKSLGEIIDSYDVVIRMNSGPVLGYEGDVGRRTTFRLFYPESVFSDPIHYDPNTTAVLVVFKLNDLKWLWDLLSGQREIKMHAFWKKPATQMIYKPNQIRILNPAITRRTAYELLHLPRKFSKKERPKHPTTGLIAITFAFSICSEVHLAGFKYNLVDRNSTLHYYGNETMSLMTQNAYHDIAAEQRFLKELVDRKIVINLTEE